ncbi:DUF4113 domain-containing protein [Salmonella enterica]|nr:DUF4113 domain-containing protein [Salmonella enterica]ECE4927812.1 DUF4113 domain-containing protein [Salmonella enterica subsp. enterica]ECU0462718.1 DUF4113 domain-containing protein [Salmonella enterica subsp. enterica serovar Orion]EGJ8410111.1 DUF4113 domain-containing protein [Salmonella enterica]
MFHTIVSIKNDGHYFCRAGGNRPDGLNEPVTMKTLDELNQSGKGKVWFAGRGTAPEWQMKREMLSQCYTTKWRDIPLARLG